MQLHTVLFVLVQLMVHIWGRSGIWVLGIFPRFVVLRSLWYFVEWADSKASNGAAGEQLLVVQKVHLLTTRLSSSLCVHVGSSVQTCLGGFFSLCGFDVTWWGEKEVEGELEVKKMEWMAKHPTRQLKEVFTHQSSSPPCQRSSSLAVSTLF